MQSLILADTSDVYSRALGQPDLTREAVCISPLQDFMDSTFPVRPVPQPCTRRGQLCWLAACSSCAAWIACTSYLGPQGCGGPSHLAAGARLIASMHMQPLCGRAFDSRPFALQCTGVELAKPAQALIRQLGALLDNGGWDEGHANGRELATIVRLRVSLIG